MVRCYKKFVLTVFCGSLFVFSGIGDLKSAEQPTIEAFKRALIKKDINYFHKQLSFDQVFASLNHSETQRYHQASSLRSSDLSLELSYIEELDFLAFSRTYPYLTPVFQSSFLRQRFKDIYLTRFSYGRKRLFALTTLRDADKFAQSDRFSLAPLFMDTKGSAFGSDLKSEHKSYGFLVIGFDRLFKLAVCTGYKPAVLDALRYSRIERKVKLSPLLSYLLYLQVKQKDVRAVYEKIWLDEINQGLSLSEQKRYKRLINDGQLEKDFRYCRT